MVVSKGHIVPGTVNDLQSLAHRPNFDLRVRPAFLPSDFPSPSRLILLY